MSASASDKGLRQSRASFEKSLRKILQRISCGEWVDLQWNDSFLPGGPFTGKAKATALWVVGSGMADQTSKDVREISCFKIHRLRSRKSSFGENI